MADRPARERLDQALVARGLAPTRSKAQAYVLAGLVTITPACGFVDVTGAMVAGVLGAGAVARRRSQKA